MTVAPAVWSAAGSDAEPQGAVEERGPDARGVAERFDAGGGAVVDQPGVLQAPLLGEVVVALDDGQVPDAGVVALAVR